MKNERHFKSNEIDLLLALSHSRSFSEVAVPLGVTQSAISRSVKEIEARLDKKLLIRGKSGSTPTPALLKLAPKLRNARRALDSLLEQSKIAQPLRGLVRVAGFRSAISMLLPSAVTSFMACNQGVRVGVATIPEVGLGVQGALLRGKADFGLTTDRPRRGLRGVQLGSDPYVLVRSARSRRRSISKHECLILWSERCSDRVPEILKTNGWSPIETMRVDSDLGVLAMVAEGAGFSILPKLATEPLPHGVERMTLPNGMRREIWLCATPEAWDAPLNRDFRLHISEAIRTILQDKLQEE